VALLTRCKEAVIALSGLSSYGRFVYSGASAAPTSHAHEQFQPWESPISRALKDQPMILFTTPSPEQVAELERSVAARMEAERRPPAPRFREQDKAGTKEEPPPVEEKSQVTPSETDVLRQRLESALEDNKKLMLRLTSWLSAKKVDASVQTPGLLVCSACQEAKPTVVS